jgi:hypothetical protein
VTRVTRTPAVATAAVATAAGGTVGRTIQPCGTPAVLQYTTAASAEPAPSETDARVESAATVKPALTQPVFFNISILLINNQTCSLAMDRSVTAADVRCIWTMAARRNIP